MSLELVRCGLDDLTSLASISIETYKQHYSYLWHDQGAAYMKEQFNKQTLKQQVLDNKCDYFRVELEDRLIGVLKLNYFSEVADYPPEHCMEIQRIYLLSDYMGKGLGSEIFNLIEKLACRKNNRWLWLMAMDSSAAKSFYQKHGYQVVQKTSFEHPEIRDQLKGMYIMVKLLR
jgi:GNAT superfamily N-acetyltransferase